MASIEIQTPIDQMCGQLLVAGFEGERIPKGLAAALVDGHRGGVVLFKRNLPTVEAAHELCSSIAKSSPKELPPFVAVDQEGGRVSRLPEPFLALPPMRVLGEIGDKDLVQRAARVVARQLAALGFNLNFAPVLDVDSNPKNPVIGDRSFGSDADHVARFGGAFIEGQREGGVLSCGKHFPGHGDTDKDSHVDLPRVERAKDALDLIELPPFRAAALKKVDTLMSAHVVYEELHPGVPATLSPKICTDLLRGEIGFQGVLFSDDLEMKALADRQEIEETAVAAVRAGCDALLICRDLDLQQRAHDALVKEAETDDEFRNRCAEAATRVLSARIGRPPSPVAKVEELAEIFDDDEAAEIAKLISERSSEE